MTTPASFVTLEEETRAVDKKKNTHLIFGTLIVFLAFIVILKFVINYLIRENEIIHEVGVSLPETWYYNRSMMNLPPCQEEELVFKDKVFIGYVDRNCSDVASCINVIQYIADEANFFITTGHVFEGYGWRCNATDTLTIKFLGLIDWNETLLYYVLLKDGIANRDLHPTIRVSIDKTSCKKDACTLLLHLDAPPLPRN